ncbi:adenylyltransferase/cytidyltransferase family protein [Candidatus Daviesbacteria bacterium]|nr:adenylyltransferase/cytidyltransferase family protein [Candidatus Daviesbacteria bacterium]
MKKIIKLNNLNKLIKSIKDKKKVLVGGCFDILHIGHIYFLEKAKEKGDKLLVLLESDEKIKRLKGLNRPVNDQLSRAIVLSGLQSIDFIILLPFLDSEREYDELVVKIKPQIIVSTKGNSDIKYLKRSAQKVGGKLVLVPSVSNHSSSSILSKI